VVPRFFELPEQFYALLRASPRAVLLHSSKPDPAERYSWLFLDPLALLTLDPATPPKAFFDALAAHQQAGNYVAGYLAYEAGYALVGLPTPTTPPYPLAQFGVYRHALRFDHLTGQTDGPLADSKPAEPATVHLDDLTFGIAEAAYLQKLAQIQAYLNAGDAYQINFTDAYTFTLHGDALELYRQLTRAQRVSYGAFLKLSGMEIACLSPELFFRIDGNTITARPMKGTLARGRTLTEDDARALELSTDEKSRAENVMIVDLLRNDLGRVCEVGSVQVPSLFEVERFESLLQMTSTVQGRMRSGVTLHELFRSLFPCGSVTGAPKRRAMEIVHELERAPRGVYTGAIGFLAPGGEAVFNVAIRTLVLRQEGGRMGVGSGIVHGSAPQAEYAECALKASFLTHSRPVFELFETMRWDGSYAFLEDHLARMEASARYFGYPFDRDEARRLLLDTSANLGPNTVYRVKLCLSIEGALDAEAQPFMPASSQPLHVALSTVHTNSQDPLFHHKTTHRPLYDAATKEAREQGLADLLFLNERSELTEGAISNVFIEKDGMLLTPPLTSGVLPGIYRQHLLRTGEAVERILRPEDLLDADALYLGNALRGLRRVEFRRIPAPTA
jgi:para-aminobenzoate synthetase/4-amino-4-deoxychorismate lyase